MMDRAMLVLVSPRSVDVHGYLAKRVCIDMNEGSIGSMRALGITESYKLKRQVVSSASEAAEMIIRYVLSHSRTAKDGLLTYTHFQCG